MPGRQPLYMAYRRHCIVVSQTPLEILATFLPDLKIKQETAVKLFSSYNAFLGLPDDEKRERLKKLSLEEVPTDAVFGEVRRISRVLQEGLTALFFHDNEKLRDLTIFYGVF